MAHSSAVTVTSGRSAIAGTLFRPEDVDRPPVVVMAPGFAARRTWGLPAFAERFAASGIAVLTFDYRGFGDSGGGPRRVVDAEKQREDYRAAIRYTRDRSDLDAESLALWGMSFSGGHVVHLATTENPQAVVAMVPFTDGLRVAARALQVGGGAYLSGIVAALARDARQMLFRRDPATIPVVSDGEEFAVLAGSGYRAAYESMIPEDERSQWPNRTAARVLAKIPFIRPITAASDIDAPVFVLQATDDEIVPSGSVDRLVDAVDDVRRVRVPAGHFEVLAGAVSSEIADEQARFLREHLRE